MGITIHQLETVLGHKLTPYQVLMLDSAMTGAAMRHPRGSGKDLSMGYLELAMVVDTLKGYKPRTVIMDED